MYISGAKAEEYRSNISGGILDIVFNCLSGTIYDVNLQNTKTWIFFFTLKSLSNKQQLCFIS